MKQKNLVIQVSVEIQTRVRSLQETKITDSFFIHYQTAVKLHEKQKRIHDREYFNY